VAAEPWLAIALALQCCSWCPGGGEAVLAGLVVLTCGSAPWSGLASAPPV
jgi:hypothetical protein